LHSNLHTNGGPDVCKTRQTQPNPFGRDTKGGALADMVADPFCKSISYLFLRRQSALPTALAVGKVAYRRRDPGNQREEEDLTIGGGSLSAASFRSQATSISCRRCWLRACGDSKRNRGADRSSPDRRRRRSSCGSPLITGRIRPLSVMIPALRRAGCRLLVHVGLTPRRSPLEAWRRYR